MGDAIRDGQIDPTKLNMESFAMAQKSSGIDIGLAELSDVANLCLWLCSPYSAVVNGACIPADKGWSAY